MKKRCKFYAIITAVILAFIGIVPTSSSTIYASEVFTAETAIASENAAVDSEAKNSFIITDTELMPYFAALDFVSATKELYKQQYEYYPDAYWNFGEYITAFDDIMWATITKTNETITTDSFVTKYNIPSCTELTGMVYDVGTIVVTESHDSEEFGKIVDLLPRGGLLYFDMGLSTEPDGEEAVYEDIWFPGLLSIAHRGPLRRSWMIYLTEDGTWEALKAAHLGGYSVLSKPGVYSVAYCSSYIDTGYGGTTNFAPQAVFHKATLIVQKEQK